VNKTILRALGTLLAVVIGLHVAVELISTVVAPLIVATVIVLILVVGTGRYRQGG